MGFPDGSDGNPAMQETQVQSLGLEDALRKGMATHSSILAWRIPWTKERSLEGYSPWGHKESDTAYQLNTHAQWSVKILLIK